MESQPTPPEGLIAGKYEVVRLIGRGGMGSVWEGRHVTLETRVAIKFIDSEYAESKEARARFDTEARAAAALRSKHAIQIYDHGVTADQRPYMVMELLTGEPLDDRIDRLGRIPLQDTALIISQVCRALQRAHEAGIIHRDLKPENIFLVRSPDDDDDEIAKVLDFGIAKIKTLPGEQGLTSSTKTGAVLGTPYYMAPEQARGLRTIDSRADLWSLGVIAYKCVTGVLPFDGESVGDLLVKICTAPPPVPSALNPTLPPGFDTWFARTMEREPARRFASATQLAEALTLAAGMSVRRGQASSPQDGGAPPFDASYPQLPDLQTPMPAAGLTSAPFVTSAEAPRSSRGARLAVVAVALLATTAGIVGGIRVLYPERGASLARQVVHGAATVSADPAAVPLATSASSTAAIAPSASASSEAMVAPPASAGAATSLSAVTSSPTASGHHKLLPGSKTSTAGPAKSAPPKATATPAPTQTSSDPGY